jgi:integrase/recombinase XerC
LWLKQGKDLKTVQALLGHNNIATTSRYLHPDDEMLQDAVDSFDSLMPGY